jgi:hypothetical protein
MFDASSPSVWSTTVHEDRRRACLRTCQSRRQVNWPWSRRRVTALASWLPFSEPTIVQHLVVNGCLGHCWVQYTAALQAYFDSRMSFAVQWSKLACPCGGRWQEEESACEKKRHVTVQQYKRSSLPGPCWIFLSRCCACPCPPGCRCSGGEQTVDGTKMETLPA